MQYRRLGRSGLRVSALGLGSWLTLGSTVDAGDTRRLVRTAFDAGVNLFDTADVYDRGNAERALGEAVADLPRRHLVLASKCYFPMSDGVNDRGLSRKHVVESLHGSLQRLGTDYLDLFQCHRPDPETPLAETCGAMHDLITRGDLLYWGVSAWPGHRIAAAVALCRARGWHEPIADQPCYNLLERGIETEVLPACAEHGVGLLVYSPLAQGVLTGKYRPDAPPPADSRAADERTGRFPQRFLAGDRVARAARFAELAAAHEVAPAQLALLWCLRRPEVASALVGARTTEQLQQNLAAFDTALGAAPFPDELERALDDLFPAP